MQVSGLSYCPRQQYSSVFIAKQALLQPTVRPLTSFFNSGGQISFKFWLQPPARLQSYCPKSLFRSRGENTSIAVESPLIGENSHGEIVPIH